MATKTTAFDWVGTTVTLNSAQIGASGACTCSINGKLELEEIPQLCTAEPLLWSTRTSWDGEIKYILSKTETPVMPSDTSKTLTIATPSAGISFSGPVIVTDFKTDVDAGQKGPVQATISWRNTGAITLGNS